MAACRYPWLSPMGVPVRWASMRVARSCAKTPAIAAVTRRVPATRPSLALRMPLLLVPTMSRCSRPPIPAASSMPWIPRPATWSWTAGTRLTTLMRPSFYAGLPTQRPEGAGRIWTPDVQLQGRDQKVSARFASPCLKCGPLAVVAKHRRRRLSLAVGFGVVP